MQHNPVQDTAKAPAEAFTGDVYVTALKKLDDDARLIASLVRFTPGARTSWHSHAAGQTLYCTEGVGLVVGRDGTVLRLHAGETVVTPPGEEHWHGGTESTVMCHVAMLEGLEDRSGDGTTWLEAVTEEEYAAANQA